jgi:hypothetical protein
VIQEELGFRQAPPEMLAFRAQLGQLFEEVKAGGPGPLALDDALCPLLKTVVMYARRMRTVELEGPRQRTLNHDLLDFLDRELAPFDTVIQQPWMHATAAARLPELSDFLTVERTDARLASLNVTLPERQYDEKFHILQAPSLFVKDLHYCRVTRELKGEGRRRERRARDGPWLARHSRRRRRRRHITSHGVLLLPDEVRRPQALGRRGLPGH